MAIDEKFLAFIQGQLVQFPDFKAKKMFGGVGFFRDEAMFGLLKDDAFMLRTHENDLGPYAGQAQFTVDMKGKAMTMPYHVVPEHVIAQPATLAQWAHVAWELTLAAKAKKKKK
jgi:DNA transformation protein